MTCCKKKVKKKINIHWNEIHWKVECNRVIYSQFLKLFCNGLCIVSKDNNKTIISCYQYLKREGRLSITTVLVLLFFKGHLKPFSFLTLLCIYIYISLSSKHAKILQINSVSTVDCLKSISISFNCKPMSREFHYFYLFSSPNSLLVLRGEMRIHNLRWTWILIQGYVKCTTMQWSCKESIDITINKRPPSSQGWLARVEKIYFRAWRFYFQSLSHSFSDSLYLSGFLPSRFCLLTVVSRAFFDNFSIGPRGELRPRAIVVESSSIWYLKFIIFMCISIAV